MFVFPAAGLQIVFTLDEVDFVQNLVFYVENAYRIPVSSCGFFSMECMVTKQIVEVKFLFLFGHILFSFCIQLLSSIDL